MKRTFASFGALACTLLLPVAGAAASAPATGAVASTQILAHGSASGTITAIEGTSFTIQTAGRRIGVVNALSRAADSVTRGDYPYVYGGGHERAGTASIGIRGPGYNGRRVGFDCSGAVAAVLAGAGLWTAGTGVPNDAGIVSQLLSEQLIARGVGTGPVEVTLYDDPGVHIFMNIDGGFFGTSDGAGGGDPRGGAGWLYDGAPDASSRVYKAYHFLPFVLKGTTTTGHSLTFQLGDLQSLPAELQVGQKVQVSYQEQRTGDMIATAIT